MRGVRYLATAALLVWWAVSTTGCGGGAAGPAPPSTPAEFAAVLDQFRQEYGTPCFLVPWVVPRTEAYANQGSFPPSKLKETADLLDPNLIKVVRLDELCALARMARGRPGQPR